ncbi:Uncharacterised protein [Mycobacteroides abscessus subsp. abscessus]|nr:Uncharacterised protein [Mycobacteroides abscessus subsp. abscessus]
MFSRTVPATSCTSWKTNPTLAYSSSGVSVRMSVPSMRIAPRSTSWNRANNEASVDLPEPDGPTRAVTVPCRNVKLTSWMTGTPGR